MPVLNIGTYDAEGLPNAMNAAWGGLRYQSGNDLSFRRSQDHGEYQTDRRLYVSVFFALGIAPIASLTDLFTKGGWDTVTVPAAVSLVLCLSMIRG